MADGKTAVSSVPENLTLVERIRAIEKRWGKEFMEVLADIHDHLFGVSPPVVDEQPPAAGDANVPVDPNAAASQQTSDQAVAPKKEPDGKKGEQP